ncbi:putative lipoprotein [Ktedonobacter racemifer DSM 44963]|uniref:Putative lipoprotein n=2 Tax=Ktedonobacter racemifer TaxID=363277 RepID=D6TWF7_KTERA|nr:putative lipoprotein [Ktedonobacter racemifer DSM 44963]
MKMTRVRKHSLLIILTLCLVILAGCGGASSMLPASTPVPTQSGPASKEQPVPVVSGSQISGSDIPDTQAFVTSTSSTGHYQLEVPEGWAQTSNGANVSFTSNLNALQVTLTNATSQPSASTVRNDQVPTLQQTGRAIRDVKVRDVQLPNGPATLITYTSNSDPNSVTNKQVRLENNRYLFYHNGKLATLTLSAPVGADNVDQWARIARSFKWV